MTTEGSISTRPAHSEHRDIADRPTPVLVCEDVSVFYGTFEAVRGVSLEFGHNEIAALIGPSGCGKSTLLRSTA